MILALVYLQQLRRKVTSKNPQYTKKQQQKKKKTKKKKKKNKKKKKKKKKTGCQIHRKAIGTNDKLIVCTSS